MTDVRSLPELVRRSRADPTRSPSPVTNSRAENLRCSECGSALELGGATACPRCLGPLAVAYALNGITGTDPVQQLGGRPPTIWRYEELLPAVERAWIGRFEVGGTPLRRAPRLAESLGLREVYLKDETGLPTGSFKDRAAALAVARAVDLGLAAVGCASTGNLAAATARAAAIAGVACFVFVPAGLPSAKLAPARQFGARVVEVGRTYDDANRVANLVGESGKVGLVNVTLRPFYTEGSKTLLFETAEASGWTLPDALVVPLGSGALLAATGRAQEELRQIGWVRDAPARLIGSQPDGCAPIADAFDRGDSVIQPVEHPDTIAESLAIGDPASADEALRAIRSTGGAADSPTTEEVLRGIRDLARLEGTWVEPAGGTVVATARRLRESGRLARGDRAVLYLTGAGWKSPQSVDASIGAPSPLRIEPAAPDLGAILQEISWAAGAERPTGERPW